MNRLDGRSAIVIGGSSPIGSASATLLAAHGASVLVVGPDAAANERVARLIVDQGGTAEAFSAAPTQNDSIAEAVETARRTFGRLDILHNAVVPDHSAWANNSRLFGIDFQRRERAHTLIVRATALACHHAVATMLRDGRGGSIVTTFPSSPAHIRPTLVALTEALATAFGPVGIRCNGVATGTILTPTDEEHVAEADLEDWLHRVTVPRLGTPSDVASAVLYLCSDDAGYVNGQILSVDGGQRLADS